MKPFTIAAFALCLLATAAGAECVRPVDPWALAVSIGWISYQDPPRSIEIFAGGRMRAITSAGREETWIATRAVAEILRSLQSFDEFFEPAPAGREARRQGYFQLAVHCIDVETGEARADVLDISTGSLQQELRAIDAWLSRLRLAERGQPVWGHGNPYPEICQPEARRRLGLAVLRPEWCVGRVGGLRFGAEGRTREEIRELLRKRLKHLPRGLQDAGESSEN